MNSFKQTPNTWAKRIDISWLSNFLGSLTVEDVKVIRDQIEQWVVVEDNIPKYTIDILDFISRKLKNYRKEYGLSVNDFEEAIIFCLDKLSNSTSTSTNEVKWKVMDLVNEWDDK